MPTNNTKTLEISSAYMLNNKGDLLTCGVVHPYIKYIIQNNNKQEIEDLFNERLNNLLWFYDNTLNTFLIEDIEIFVSSVINSDNYKIDKNIKERCISQISIDNDRVIKDVSTIEELFLNINHECNQEFCRVRTSHMKAPIGTSGDVYFRISSVGFNWFNLIWNVTHTNYNFVDSVTICTDTQSTGKPLQFYRWHGKSINKMPTEKFITLSGNPIIESKNAILKMLSDGHSLNESFGQCSYIHVNACHDKLLEKQFDNKFFELKDTEMNNYKQYTSNLYEDKQERTAYNAFKAYPNYIDKYGKGSALFELKHNFRLSDEELVWIINRAVEKAYITEEDKAWNIEYLGLEEYFKEELEEELLSEDIEGMKKYYPNIPDDKFQAIIELDPTYKQGSNNAGTYGRWLLAIANKNNGEIDNVGHVKDLLTRFEENKKVLKNKDIMKFKSVQEVEDYLNDENNYNELTDRQKLRQTQTAVRKSDVTKDAEKVYEDEEWEIWVPKTYEASCKLGQGTSWCTASTSSDYYYDRYTSDGSLYINIKKKNGAKFQFHFESHQYMNADDEEIDIFEFFKKYPKLVDFYSNIKSADSDSEIKIDLDEFIDCAKNRNMSPKFLRAVFENQFGDSFDLIDYFDVYGVSFSDIIGLIKYLSDGNKKLLNSLGIQSGNIKNVIDSNSEDYDEDIYDAFARSATDGLNGGAIEACLSDFDRAIKDVFKYPVELKDDELIIKIDDDKERFIYSLFDEDELACEFGNKFGNKFYEPRYGWYGFSEETFNNRLSNELYDLGASVNTEESLTIHNKRKYLKEALNEDVASVKARYPKIDDDTFMHIIAIDPTYNSQRDSVGTYGKWLLDRYSREGDIILDNAERITSLLSWFDTNKRNLPASDRDINKFKNVNELVAFINEADIELSHRQEVRNRQKERRNADISKDAEKVFENNEWVIYIPKTYAASCKLGQGTTWCTASTESDMYFKQYSGRGNLYININKKTGDKYQFHFESESFMDSSDEPIDLFEFLNDNPSLKTAYRKTIKYFLEMGLFVDSILHSSIPIIDIYNDYGASLFSQDLSSTVTLYPQGFYKAVVIYLLTNGIEGYIKSSPLMTSSIVNKYIENIDDVWKNTSDLFEKININKEILEKALKLFGDDDENLIVFSFTRAVQDTINEGQIVTGTEELKRVLNKLSSTINVTCTIIPSEDTPNEKNIRVNIADMDRDKFIKLLDKYSPFEYSKVPLGNSSIRGVFYRYIDNNVKQPIDGFEYELSEERFFSNLRKRISLYLLGEKTQ